MQYLRLAPLNSIPRRMHGPPVQSPIPPAPRLTQPKHHPLQKQLNVACTMPSAWVKEIKRESKSVG